MTIPLGRPLPDASRDLPGWLRRKRRLPHRFPGRPAIPMRSCSRWGLPCHRRYRRRGALLPHPFTLTTRWPPGLRPGIKRVRRSALCGTFPGVAPAGSYPAPCFRGARTFLERTVTGAPAVIQPSGAGTSREAGWGSQPTSPSARRPQLVILKLDPRVHAARGLAKYSSATQLGRFFSFG